ncbi:POZ [Glarea lozoyensis ATCC 20868]|uniref:POZ n=1 Tax=Glarea lozoyensis (strain ATCC 20868 / MF5171) TaxID=1116229 RepID=S3CK78_GLAL2|nr:POZ [Glarea lozoyensis ATCC 20868]EPE26165.1 POZ [Glarea lozoyensis ATCC 20868]
MKYSVSVKLETAHQNVYEPWASPDEKNDPTSRNYSSPLVTLVVGSGEKTETFYVHKHSLLKFPYFNGALRPGAFMEGKDEKMNFPEEDPAVFHRLVEFIYEGKCYPRIINEEEMEEYLEAPIMVVKDVPNSLAEGYDWGLESSIACGSHLTTDETLSTVTGIIQLLCLAHRYGINDLCSCCLDKLRLCPFGTREVTALIELVSTQIPETESTSEIYAFMYEHIRIQKPRLDDCLVFERLFENRAVPSQTLLQILKTTKTKQIEYMRQISLGIVGVAVCHEEVTAADSQKKYGTDDKPHFIFGSAKIGEVSSGRANNSEGLFLARNNPVGDGVVFPLSSFFFLKKNNI